MVQSIEPAKLFDLILQDKVAEGWNALLKYAEESNPDDIDRDLCEYSWSTRREPSILLAELQSKILNYSSDEAVQRLVERARLANAETISRMQVIFFKKASHECQQAKEAYDRAANEAAHATQQTGLLKKVLVAMSVANILLAIGWVRRYQRVWS